MNHPQTNQRRYHDLDALRGFAMLLGIVLHGAMSFVALPVSVNATQDIYQDSPVYGWIMDAIHGFRLPLFFLVSGMFTALLWRRRGMSGLIRHRAKRIGLPLLLGLFTIVPAVFAVQILLGRNIWHAAARGDMGYVESYIGADRDLNEPLNAAMQPGDGGSPLHMAAGSGQYEVARRLLAAGASIHARAEEHAQDSPSLATPLHWAAFKQDPEMVRLLLEHGASCNAIDASNATPLDYASAEPEGAASAILVAAGGKYGSELDATTQAQSQAALQAAEQIRHSSPQQPDYLGTWIRHSPAPIQVLALFCFLPLFAHLWFLWYLLWLVAIFALAVPLVRKLGLTESIAGMVRSPQFLYWLLPLTFLAQLSMVQTFGPDTASGLIPWPPTLFYYALFFLFGAAYYLRAAEGQPLAENSVRYLVLAAIALPIGIFAIHSRPANFALYQCLASLSGAVYAWMMILGLFGLFRRFCSSENAWVRYLSDASYWIYLVHLPIVQMLQSWFSDWSIPSMLKFAAICGITFAVALASYELMVRYTWIGSLLHGRKHRPKREVAAPLPVLE